MKKQTDLESQQTEDNIPAYDPSVQVDITQQQKLRGKNIVGTTYSDSRVVTTFDARPVNGQDFVVNGGTLTPI